MKSITAVVLALILLPLDPSPAPFPEADRATQSLRVAPVVAPTGQANASETVIVHAPISTTDTRSNPRPRWPEGWPSLDLSPALVGPQSADRVQTMGVGELDLVLEGTGGDPAGERQVAIEADFAEVGDRQVAIEADPAGDRQTGTLSGTVVDTQGDPLPGVSVTLAGIGSPTTQFTNARGEFRFYDLPPGQRTLIAIAELSGFSTVEYPDVSIRAGTNTRLEVTLSPAVEEVITVTSESPLLDERKIQQGTTISQIELDKIPTARDPWEVITQTPGVISDRDGANVFVVDGVILSGPEAALRGLPTLYDFDSIEELGRGLPPLPEPGPRGSGRDLGVTTNVGPDFPPSSDVTINAITRGGRNSAFTNGRLFGDQPGDHPADWIDPAYWDQVQIDIGQRPDGTSCLEGIGATDTDGNPLAMEPGEVVHVVLDPSLYVTLDNWQEGLDPGTRIVKFPACDDEGWSLYAFDINPSTGGAPEGGPEGAPGVKEEAEVARTGDEVTIRLADGTAGIDVTLIDQGEPRPLGTTGEGGVTRVPADEVEDGTALIAYAVVCGEDRQIVLVPPEDEEAFLEAYGDCAGRRLERFAWFAGDVFVDVRGLARWIPYPPEVPQPADDLEQVPGDEKGVDEALPGTSMAPPQVAGGAALLLQNDAPESPDASIDPAISPEALSGPSGRAGSDSDIKVVFLGTGGSTGAVVEAYLVNHGYEPVRIQTEGLVLEPVPEEDLDPATRTRLQEILGAASSGRPLSPRQSGTEAREARVVRVVLDAYCLDFAKDVPVAGTLFRIADREAQQEAARFREVVRASRRLQELEALHPDGEPESYFHSTRQWAAWADELELDRDGFEEAFVEHARKNFDAAGRPWSAEVEEQVRALVPNRWADLTAVLDEADRSPGRIR